MNIESKSAERRELDEIIEQHSRSSSTGSTRTQFLAGTGSLQSSKPQPQLKHVEVAMPGTIRPGLQHRFRPL